MQSTTPTATEKAMAYHFTEEDFARGRPRWWWSGDRKDDFWIQLVRRGKHWPQDVPAPGQPPSVALGAAPSGAHEQGWDGSQHTPGDFR